MPKTLLTLKYHNKIQKVDVECDNSLILRQKITEVPPEVYKMPLKSLILSSSYLTIIPPDIGDMAQLEILNLHHCSIRKLFLPPNLKELNLVANSLYNIPALDNKLEILHLNSNLIYSPDIGNLTNLKELYLQYNQIRILPKSFYNLTALTKLDLSNNNLQELSIEIGKLTNLTYLNVSSNKLTYLPEDIYFLNLEYLNIGYNKISYLSRNIYNLRQLKTIKFDGTNILSLPIEIISLKLQQIDFDKNIDTSNPLIRQFLDKKHKNIYDNKESVHDIYIKKCLIDSIFNILADITNNNLFNINDISTDIILTCETKKLLIEFIGDTDIAEEFGITFADIFIPIWARINLHPSSTEIKKIVNCMIYETCTHGRISNLVSCLCGFYDDVNINISELEQINNIALLAMRKTTDISTYKKIITTELNERGYSTDVIDNFENI